MRRESLPPGLLHLLQYRDVAHAMQDARSRPPPLIVPEPVETGDTRVLCTASLENKVPPFLRGKGQGWVTAEYGMLPRATHTRGDREAARGKQSARCVRCSI
jgi:hypothetical protein